MSKYTIYNNKIKTKLQLMGGKNMSRKWGQKKFVVPKFEIVALTNFTSQPVSSQSATLAA